MASSQELVDLFNEGALGDLIAKEFGGEKGHTPPRKDADFLVVFSDAQRVPSLIGLITCIKTFYTEKGYSVDLVSSGGKTSVLLVYFNRDQGAVTVTITGPYSQEGAEHAVWVSSSNSFI